MNFIEIYDDIILPEECDLLIKKFNNVDITRKVFTSQSAAKKVGTTLYCGFTDSLYDDFNIPLQKSLNVGLERYRNKYPCLETSSKWDIDAAYNVQKFADGGGYFTLHCEQDDIQPSRMLVWMIYLNDALSGTEFPNQDTVIQPKKGRMVVWPAAWTHSHKGVTPNKGDKYMATGWCSYKK